MAQTAQTTRSSWMGRLLTQRSVQITLGAWLMAILVAYLLGGGGLPFDRPLFEGAPFGRQLVSVLLISVVLPVLYIGITYLITRRRTVPDIAARAPEKAVALRETLYLIVYGVLVFALGQAVGRLLFEGEGFGFHLPGAIFGVTDPVSGGYVIGWTVYNFVGYALIPYLVFRRRGYSNGALSLRSSNVRNDTMVILAVLGFGAALDLTASDIFDLTGSQILVGLPLTFVIHLLGSSLPPMIFIYSILLPRYLKISGSVPTAMMLGGLSYVAPHAFESWTAYNTLNNSILSVIFVFMQYFGPGVLKSYLTLRTGNAWVHVWAYHAISPHVTWDTSHIVRFFGIR